MILFNLFSMFNHYLFNKNSQIIHQLHSPINVHTNKIEIVSKHSRTNNLFSALIIRDEKNIYKTRQNFTNRKLVSPNFATKLMNRYWQETIFLSLSSPLSDIYINQLKSSGIAVYQNEYKKFLLDFSKALTTGRVESSLDNYKSVINSKMGPTYLKYIWRKGFNFALPEILWKSLSSQRKDTFPSKKQLILMQKIKENDFPVFAVVNGFNQLVMAESSEEMLNNKNAADKLYQWCNDFFSATKNHRTSYQGLFFINPQDAIEYRNHIEQKYQKSSKQNHLNIFANKLDLYYKLTRITVPKVQFKLIPDLTELGELIFRYKKYKHVQFHHEQTHGNNYFQGQPIYLIQPVFAFNKKLKKVMPVNYSYKLTESNDHKQYEAVFMNYKTALLAWHKFRQKATKYNLPWYPKILVYNLEDFIKTCENNDQINNRNVLLIPTKESYNFLKKRKDNQSQTHILQKFSSRLLYLQVFGKRIIWSLTSRQPTSW